MSTLFDPVTFGDIALANRVVMAPLTRSRAIDRVPNALMAEYYTQRAGAGLILSEATSVTPMGVGYADTPGIWSEAQVAGWSLVTDAVHRAGGKIVLQLWHVGRISHPVFLDGALPVAPSAIQPKGHVSHLRPKVPFPTPRALAIEEIPGIIEAYRQGAENAKRAGFDGVLVHGANGYLPDQFLQSSSNTRTDAYGGSHANRARLLLEVTDAAISVWGAGRVGVHLAPRGDGGVGSYIDHSMGDDNPVETFKHVARELGKRKIAFISTREKEGPDSIGPMLKDTFGGHHIANEAFTQDSAQAWLGAGKADAIAFGVPFIANPDLPERLRVGAAWNEARREYFYAGVEVGYTDYPTLAQVAEPA
ncbi:alkene reductase [Pseudomonas huanghezhanensis]|uniref:alkene reductase n=1 Tax=Pseudomonas huanghezhanensis TaxID=3002903 RepID=UPI002285C196|nr:alkene reductase [Pseudomonas sp. BSw22131]